MGILNKLFNKKKESPEKLALILAVKSYEFILDEKQENPRAAFEAVLFSSSYILNRVHTLHPHLYEEFNKNYRKELHLFAEEVQVLKYLTLDFSTFIWLKFMFYIEEYEKMSQDPSYLPTKMAFYFYEKPLSIAPEDNFDIPNIMKLVISLNELCPVLDKSLELIIREVEAQNK